MGHLMRELIDHRHNLRSAKYLCPIINFLNFWFLEIHEIFKNLFFAVHCLVLYYTSCIDVAASSMFAGITG